MYAVDLLPIVREFAESDEPKYEVCFVDGDVNDVAATPLSANRCIKVTIEYSDLPDQTLEQMLETVTDENRQELIV